MNSKIIIDDKLVENVLKAKEDFVNGTGTQPNIIKMRSDFYREHFSNALVFENLTIRIDDSLNSAFELSYEGAPIEKE